MTAVHRPRDPSQVAEIIRQAAADDTPLDVTGAGTMRDWGRPSEAKATLDLSDMAGIGGKRGSELPPFPAAGLLDLSALGEAIAYEPSELVVTVGPGTRLAALEATLARDHQHLAFEPPDLGPLFGHPPGLGTVGGALGANLAGPRRLKAGPARDHVMGVRGVTGRGQPFAGGGEDRRDAAGFDLPRLMTGSFGTLAVLTEATLKVVPRPEAECTLALTGLNDATALRAFAAVLHAAPRGHGLSGAAHLPEPLTALSALPEVAGAGRALTLFRIDGFERAVTARAARLAQELADYGGLHPIAAEPARRLWREIADAHPFAVRRDRVLWRLAPPPGTAAGMVAAVRRTLPADALYDWGGALVWLGLDPATTPPDGGATTIRAALAAAGDGAGAQLVRAPVSVRRAVAVFPQHTPAQAALAVRVKDHFDPRRILNRGRMYAGL